MTKLRQNALHNCHVPFLHKDISEILFQNVRPLHLHIADIVNINMLVKTALCSNDDNDLYQIPHFQLFRNDLMLHGNTILTKSQWDGAR